MEKKERKSVRVEENSLEVIEKILRSEKDHEAIIILWESRGIENKFGDEDVLPEEIQEIIATLREYNRVKKTTYRVMVLPTLSAYEFESFADYARYAIDVLNAFFWGGMDRSLIDKLKYWRFRKRK